jgi:tungstate transport system permease protein
VNSFGEILRTAISLIFSGDQDVFQAVWTSISVASWSTTFAALMGVPIGMVVGLRQFPLKRIAITLLNTLTAIPTVVIGLVIYGFISRQGPLGGLELLFTTKAIILGQTALAIPLVISYTLSAVKGTDMRVIPTALTLGASRMQSLVQVMREIRFGIMAAVIAGFSRVISEVGVAMMLGGNVRGFTRTMTTAIALETSKGEFAFGIALGIILMGVALLINFALNLVQKS